MVCRRQSRLTADQPTERTNMTIYFKDQAFYDCDTPEQAPEGALPVSPEQHAELLAALNSGCIVSDDLTVSPPRPSEYHEWDGGSWVLKPTAKKKMLQHAKSEKLAEINRTAQSYIDRAAGLDKVPEFEVATWTTQAFEAKAWHADQNAATPTLDAIAASRGVPPDALRQKAYEKTLKFERLTAYVAGLRQAAEDKINAAANLDELADISLVIDLKDEAE